MHELNTIYNEIKDNIGYYITLFRFAKEEQLTPEEVIGLINMSNDIQDLKRQYKRLNVSIVNLESILYESKEELKKLKYQSSAASELIRSKSELIERKSENPFRTNLTKTETRTIHGLHWIRKVPISKLCHIIIQVKYDN